MPGRGALTVKRKMARRLQIAAGAAICWAALLCPAAVAADEPPILWTSCQKKSQALPDDAGECHSPVGIAVSPIDGHVFITERFIGRVTEVTGWGEFVRSWGWGVQDGSPELQTCTIETGCRSGLVGGGPGQVGRPMGIEIDSVGDIYIFDSIQSRIQKFDPEGNFLLSFGGDAIEGGAVGAGVVTSGSATVTSVTTTKKAFRVGQRIEGTGIEPGTTIQALGSGTITLSKPAGPAATGSSTALTVAAAPSNVPSNEKQTVALGANTTGGTFTLNFRIPIPSPSQATTSAIPFNATAAELQSELEELSNLGAGSISVSGPAGGPWIVEFGGARFADTDVETLSVGTAGLSTAAGSPTASVKRENGFEICTAANQCRTGSFNIEGMSTIGPAAAGEGDGQMTPAPEVDFLPSEHIAIGADDELFVGGKNRIQVFDANGHYLRQLPLPQAGEASSLAVDPVSGDVYFSYALLGIDAQPAEKPDVYRLNAASGAQIATLGVGKPAGMTVDPQGNLYALDGSTFINPGNPLNHPLRILIFNSNGEKVGKIGPPEDEFFGEEERLLGFQSVGLATGSACFAADEVGIYLARGASFSVKGQPGGIRAYGPPPSNTTLCPPPQGPPSINAQWAASVGADSALLKAKINPHFWSGSAGETTYFLQYATADCIAQSGWEGGCVQERPAAPGAVLKAGVVNVDITTDGLQLVGLTPATAYRYRFIAESDGAPGVEIVGRDGKPSEEGSDAGFLTAGLPGEALTNCSNQAFRLGAGANLPDCRAYELVSPIDKNGGDVVAPLNVGGWEARLDQATPDGGGIAYSSYRAFAGAVSSAFSNHYLARRDAASGWSTKAISPPQEGEAFGAPAVAVDNMFKAFSPDLRYGWVLTATEPVLAPGGIPGHANFYRRDSLDGSYQACTTSTPKGPDWVHPPQLQGVSGDQQTAIFRARNELTEDSAPTGNDMYQLYLCTFEGSGPAQMKLVSVLPDGSASTVNNTGGGPTHESFEYEMERGATYTRSVSSDGSRVFWTASTSNFGSGPGTIYARLNPTEAESAQALGSARGFGDLAGPAKGTGNLNKFSLTVQNVTIQSGSFFVGQELTGPQLQEGTTVTELIGGDKLKLSKTPKETLAGAILEGQGSPVISNVTLASGSFQVGQIIAASGIPDGATIEAVEETSPGIFRLTISAAATAGGSGFPLSASSSCSEPEKACTVQVSVGANAEYVAATADGGQVLYLEGGPGGSLRLADVDSGEDTLIAGKAKVMGASDDLTRIYLTSLEDLALGATAGQPNLYFYEAGNPGTVTFVAGLTAADNGTESLTPSPVHGVPAYRLSRVSPDGSAVTFMSNSPQLAETVADYDNTDQASGKADFVIYRFEAQSGRLDCISCNPTGARPVARPPTGEQKGQPDVLWTAATLRPWENGSYAPRAISDDGSRIFFETVEALVLADTNGKLDVYQWEELGTGSCTAADDSFVAASGGCLDLLSTGKSSADSEFIDASADGSDVFIRTVSSLVDWDTGQVDIYDVRVDGGFPPPPSPPAACEGEACQGQPTPPNDPTPASSAFQGAGNVTTPVGRKPCGKGKVRRHGKCVKKPKGKKHRKQGKRSKQTGRAGR
ncbi:MAG TPA: hypothetical protein VFU16_03380 [Solirubrobacterales bacterium]|nr:hypothetical protein [Solirubrobacterales bacterium]